jgi:hypothetical protein
MTPRSAEAAVLRELATARLQAAVEAFGQPDDADDASLATGSAGRAVAVAHLAVASGDDAHHASAVRLLEHAMQRVASTHMDASLMNGFTGVAWAVQHVDDLLLKSPPDRLGEVDEALLGLAGRAPWVGPYDLYDGLVGLGVYARERLPRPAAVALLDRIVGRLAERAEREHGVARWTTLASQLPEPVRDHYAPRHVNLSAAHGVAGVVALLGVASQAGIGAARPLLDEAVAFLVTLDPVATTSRFPVWVADGVEPTRARSAWCNGDPGVAAALLVAARAVGEPSWERDAVATARLAATRPQDEARVVDPWLCHGAAGLAVVFQQFHAATGEALFADAATRWVDRALDLSGDRTATGLLDGAAGLALALATGGQPHPAGWTRCLLVS